MGSICHKMFSIFLGLDTRIESIFRGAGNDAFTVTARRDFEMQSPEKMNVPQTALTDVALPDLVN